MNRFGLKVWLPSILGGSGVDVHTRRLAAGLARRGVDARISWFSIYFQIAPFALASTAPPSGTNITHALSWFGFAFKRQNMPLLVSEQLDILDPLYRPYKSLPQEVFHQVLVRTFMIKSFAAATAVTAVSRATAESLARTVNLKSAKVIPNFVDTAVFRPQRDARKTANTFRLLFVGNLTKRKGADLLAPIMTKLGPGFELGFTTGLRNGRLGKIPANMISIGRLTNDLQLLHAYQECDALLFPSRLEGLPIAPLEAMACGKPVIATRTSSMPEVIEHGTTGLLCELDNIDQFAEACRTLADAPKMRQLYGEAARVRVESIFSENVVVPQYMELYQSLMDRKTDYACQLESSF